MESRRGRTAAPLEEKHMKKDLKWNPGRASRPASAAVRVTDLSWRGNLNPSPLIKDDEELLMDEYLSPRKLKALTGMDDLQQVKALEMRVDTRESSLGNFGAYLPNLRELKLNNSLLVSVRDLGTTLSHLHVLWMVCCGLLDLDGISACSSLKELYIAYNKISDLCPLSFLDHLEVLDLEGNNIEDINQMQYLGLCCKLRSLTAQGNLICLKPNAESAEELDYNYRAEVKKLIPHLEYLDGIPASQTAVPPSNKMNEDWLIIKESIKEGGLPRDISWLGPCAMARQPGSSPRLPTTSRPGTAQWSASAGSCSNSHLLYNSSPLLDPTISEDLFLDDSSDLTHGLSQVICGNPIKALRARRLKLGPPAASSLKLCSLKIENPDISVEGGDVSQEDVFSVPSVWREQHKPWCLHTAQQESVIPAAKLATDDEEEDEGCSLASGGESELRDTSDEDLTEGISPDSSCHSCLSQSSSAIPRELRKHRARCLKLTSPEEGRQPQQCQARATRETSAQLLGKGLALLSLHSAPAAQESLPFSPQRQCQPDGSTARQRPISGPAAVGSAGVSPTLDRSPCRVTSHPQPVVLSSPGPSGRVGLLNAVCPPAAGAVLQKLPPRPSVSSASQSRSPRS
ncbi:leucine-rich repeat-containing protein 56 [Meleagris gallopavo]|uniref:Leucine rich repeat containing 56 n=2 Tax=Meleagris gallopavo TaxID=9103 RepID=A0A803YJR0_MELGA|nr:leucine-rich repeat-containing protein 56 [Meleagris gallopavo]XP_031409326.1 leucine-rich repeat-containing protein 56 [Meleagris gallopavo]